MKIYYIDAENTGLSMLGEMQISALDRVFIFTNAQSQMANCANPLLTFVSGYPSGKNQADFHLVAHLGKVLACLTRPEKMVVELVLCSNDTQLWKAFEFQCTLAETRASNPLIAPDPAKSAPAKAPVNKAPVQSNVVVTLDTSLEAKILKLMQQPVTFGEIHGKLNVSQSLMTTSFNQLIKAGRIKRQPNAKKKWLCVANK